MKLTITYTTGTSYDDEALQSVEYELESKDNKLSLSFNDCNECPEDATFNRDLASALHIKQVVELAYNAGKNGESLDITEEDNNE